ncbi:MAG: hypothetical protein ACI9TH_000340, partial [Kiritimatiellia bacterium]
CSCGGKVDQLVEGVTEKVAGPRMPVYAKDAEPLLVQFCYDCHGDDSDKGGVALDGYADTATLLSDHATWKLVRENLVTGKMPPEDKAQPSDAERKQLIAWIDQGVFQIDPRNPDPGRVTIRRLNRQEYNNTIRDLVGVHFQPANDFPADDSGYGFDNIGDVLTLSPLLVEKYLRAAEQVLEKALVTDVPKPGLVRISAKQMSGGNRDGEDLRCLPSEGEITFNHEFEKAGEYLVIIKAFASQAGPETAKMRLEIDGKNREEFFVRATTDAREVYEKKLELAEGRRKIGVEFLNDYYKENEGDRNLYVEYVAIEGPIGEALDRKLPETHKRIIFKEPDAGADLTHAREIITRFASRAYRRPVTEVELNRLLPFVRMAMAEGESWEAGIKLALQAVLVSPQFLFRGEVQPNPDNPEEITLISEYDLASRLSYFIWSSMPDETLYRLAEQNQLRANLGREVRRMLDNPKSRALAENFAGQWLRVRDIRLVKPDPEYFTDFDDALREAMLEETMLFFTSIQRENRSLLDFLTADYTFVNDRLARHYGIEGVDSRFFQRVHLDTQRRSGVLTHASVLTLTSHATRTSPVNRGVWVLDSILGTPPPPPPPDVPSLETVKAGSEGETLTNREMLELHRGEGICANCHRRMDPIGFAMEHYDAVGVWRLLADGVPVEPAGQLDSGETFSGFAGLRDILADQKKDLFIRNVTRKMLTYALGRGLEVYDEAAVENITSKLPERDYRFADLVFGVVQSVPFQKRRGDRRAPPLATLDKPAGSD